jgi:hypothetical protein
MPSVPSFIPHHHHHHRPISPSKLAVKVARIRRAFHAGLERRTIALRVQPVPIYPHPSQIYTSTTSTYTHTHTHTQREREREKKVDGLPIHFPKKPCRLMSSAPRAPRRLFGSRSNSPVNNARASDLISAGNVNGSYPPSIPKNIRSTCALINPLTTHHSPTLRILRYMVWWSK